jgi:hypothetical protein
MDPRPEIQDLVWDGEARPERYECYLATRSSFFTPQGNPPEELTSPAVARNTSASALGLLRRGADQLLDDVALVDSSGRPSMQVMHKNGRPRSSLRRGSRGEGKPYM